MQMESAADLRELVKQLGDRLEIPLGPWPRDHKHQDEDEAEEETLP